MKSGMILDGNRSEGAKCIGGLLLCSCSGVLLIPAACGATGAEKTYLSGQRGGMKRDEGDGGAGGAGVPGGGRREAAKVPLRARAHSLLVSARRRVLHRGVLGARGGRSRQRDPPTCRAACAGEAAEARSSGLNAQLVDRIRAAGETPVVISSAST